MEWGPDIAMADDDGKNGDYASQIHQGFALLPIAFNRNECEGTVFAMGSQVHNRKKTRDPMAIQKMSAIKQENPNTSSGNDGRASPAFRRLPSLLSAIFLPVLGMLLMLVNLIPNSLLLDNAKAASPQLCEVSQPCKGNEESSPSWWAITTGRDCFADSIMAGVSISNSDQDIIDGALYTKFTHWKN